MGTDRANRWIATSDGGAGLEDWLRVHFARAEAVILDFYHASEYLAALGRAQHPSDEVARAGWLEDWCHRLKHEGEPRCSRVSARRRRRAARGVLAVTVRS